MWVFELKTAPYQTLPRIAVNLLEKTSCGSYTDFPVRFGKVVRLAGKRSGL